MKTKILVFPFIAFILVSYCNSLYSQQLDANGYAYNQPVSASVSDVQITQDVPGSIFFDSLRSFTEIKLNTDADGDLLKIYPNPATDKIIIDGFIGGNTEVSVYTIYGKKLMKKELTRYNEEMDIGSFPKGIYIVEFNDDERVNRLKFIKE